MMVVAQLRHNEQIFPLDFALLEQLLNAMADRLLIAIELGIIYVLQKSD